MSSPVLRLTDLRRVYQTRAGELEVLKGANLTIMPGEIVALVEAFNATQVSAHMARKTFTVASAKQHDLVDAIRAGHEVEKLGADPADAAPEGDTAES